MSLAMPLMRELAQHLMAQETREKKGGDACEKLRPHLATLMGTIGSRALLSRALALAQPEAPWLRAVHVKSDGSLEGLDELAAQVDSQEMAEGKEILLTQLLSLLVAFIGASLTLQMLRQLWPKLSWNDRDLG